MNSNKSVIVGAVIIGLLAFSVMWFANPRAPAPSSSTTLAVAVSDQDWTKGNSGNLVSLVEYSDFQCPACASYYPLLKQLVEEFGEQISLTYRHYPLREIHPNADLAARAAEAAGRQGQFWQMHDQLFEDQERWSASNKARDIFLELAGTLKLDLAKFQSDLDSEVVVKKVDHDYAGGLKSGVNSTPSFFLNGKKIINNPRNYDEFAELIRGILNPQS